MKYFYIKKRGWYFRPNSCGYTERKHWAGVYTESEIKSYKKHNHSELDFIEIDVREHNKTLQKEIDVIKANQINNEI